MKVRVVKRRVRGYNDDVRGSGTSNGRSTHLTTFPVWENYKATRLLTVISMEDK